jgi:DNA-binding FadR family transcriptional regulator
LNEEFKVSRTVVREAISEPQGCRPGLDPQQGVGAFVLQAETAPPVPHRQRRSQSASRT